MDKFRDFLGYFSSHTYESEEPHTYLYFADMIERLAIYQIEGYGTSNPFQLTITQKNQIDILMLRPAFDAALEEKSIKSIVKYSWPYYRAKPDTKTAFLHELEHVERNRGMLNALLTLRNWAFFPDDSDGSIYRCELASSYIQVVRAHLAGAVGKVRDVGQFLEWCAKRTRKIQPWGFKKRELRYPNKSALPIHEDEAVAYVRYFFESSVNEKTSSKAVEMAVCILICLACGRQHSWGFDLKEVLAVSSKDLVIIPPIPKVARVPDIREQSGAKGKKPHENLLLILSAGFLQNPDLWPKPSEMLLGTLKGCASGVLVGGRTVLVSPRLSDLIKEMKCFTITSKDVENQLQKAYKAVGLITSTGGICPKTFLARPHLWKEHDERAYWKPKPKLRKRLRSNKTKVPIK